MKKLIPFLLFANVLYAQGAPVAMQFTINSMGQVIIHTADPYAVPPADGFSPRRDNSDSVKMTVSHITTRNNHNDTTREGRNGRLTRFNFTYHTLQHELNTLHFYPDREESGFGGGWREQINDSSFVYRYNVHGWVCSNGGEYNYDMHEEWSYRADGSLKEVVAHNPHYSDTNSIVYRYEWLPSRKLKMVTKVTSLFLYNKWQRDTVTMEMVYNEKDQLIAQVAYAGPKMDSLATSIEEWTAALTKGIPRPYFSVMKIADHNGVTMQFLLTYSYGYGGQLSTCLAYDHDYTGITTDTLIYDEKLKLVRIESHSLDYVHATDFVYKNGRLTAKTEGNYFVPRPDYEGSNLGPYTERYSYDPQKRIARIDFKSSDADANSPKTFAEIVYK